MAQRGPDWANMLDLPRTLSNLEGEAIGDWHRDPWGWPEYRYLAKQPRLLFDCLSASGVSPVARVDVPKENFAARPAMVLDVLDRVAYSVLVDFFSSRLIGGLDRHVFGWRLHPSEPVSGYYERNGDEWDRFRSHLLGSADKYETLLLSDITSCFASIPVSQLADALANVLPGGIPLERLINFLVSWEGGSGRSGIPQRSSASAVLANFFLQDLDLILHGHSRVVEKPKKGTPGSSSWARWMDDMWLFGADAGALRQAQVELQSEAASLGLNLNANKTQLLEGNEAVEKALEMEHSAIDGELSLEMLIINMKTGSQRRKRKKDSSRLNQLLDEILAGPEKTDRTTLRFATTRMRSYSKFAKVPEFLDRAHRMPHGADHLARLFRDSVGVSDYQDWFLDYAASPWAMYPWAIANFGTALRSRGRPPRKATRDYFTSVLADGRSSLPLFALAAQRLSTWDADACRLALREAVRTSPTTHHLRIAAYAGLTAGERGITVRKWLVGSENQLTLRYLEDTAFRPPKPTVDFAGVTV
ncbi:RNA-directed DNA polymerase [Phycicoccus sp. MAQZ13P-2]|uniref:RNA-directed DNA polymerase n=1 Tax=Phycicoccus mangrovi TaxID=2840470 RepID=UPI001C0033F9|nr:RNA-directed DNA polymerase [Phycicoccus mangrovi]MBT9257185.1 RNA-directed DNA polymerase [Phycicoccus mangrovi]MBT9276317.1 RNA-directed DNA polymerase [Phycicoccus mangrovi]